MVYYDEELFKAKDEIRLEDKINNLELLMDKEFPKEEVGNRTFILNIKRLDSKIARYFIPPYNKAHLKLYRYGGKYILKIYIRKIIGIVKLLEIEGTEIIGNEQFQVNDFVNFVERKVEGEGKCKETSIKE